MTIGREIIKTKYFKLYLFILFTSFSLSGCVSVKSDKIAATSLNDSWKIVQYISPIDNGYNIVFHNNSLEYAYISIYTYGHDNKKENLPTMIGFKIRTNVTFHPYGKIPYGGNRMVGEITALELAEYLKNNDIRIDTSKIFFTKNQHRYALKLSNYDLSRDLSKSNKDKLYVSEDLLTKLDIKLKKTEKLNKKYNGTLSKNDQEYNVETRYGFNSPIGYQGLEDVVLEIGGIYLNGKELEPIRIKLNYTNKNSELN